MLRRGNQLICAVALVAACGSAGEQNGALLSGELSGRLGGDPFPIMYGRLIDWDADWRDWGAALSFEDSPSGVDCDGERTSRPPFPAFYARMDLATAPVSGEDWNGLHTIMQSDPRVELEFPTGQLHFDRVEDDWASGSVSWGGTGELYDVQYTFTLEGTFVVERCYWEYPGD